MLERFIKPKLKAALEDSPVVLLNGARQTGKSTLVQNLSLPATYFTLDDLSVLSSAKLDAEGFIKGLNGPVIIDEIQRAPELLLAIKASVDRDRQPGRFLLTGSANVLLLPRIAESLAGRIEIHTLWPFSQGELLGKREGFIDLLFQEAAIFLLQPSAQPMTLIDNILRGGFPEIMRRTSEPRRHAWFCSYVTTALHREIRDLANIEGLIELPQLLSLLAARVGTLLNYAELSRTAGLPQTTLKRYMALLQATFMTFTLPAWSANLGKRLVKTPKNYLTDTGLAAHLVGFDNKFLAENKMQLGHLLENFVIMELCKQSSWSFTQPSFFHYRTHNGQEVDCVLENTAGRIVGIEIKAAKTVNVSDFDGLKSFAEAAGKRFQRGIVLYTGEQIIPFGENLHALPVEMIWQHN